ncbi:hypothetical protein E2C01_005047 [Portunus trituberculatus]|uniref:Uncharacterized protein n=1 Tax=Portunus trituberculatus TaxID=210409 RepID=A0A5B7CS47_PORTR|nr:hypothetical protein [Portunus trituberculatus]
MDNPQLHAVLFVFGDRITSAPPQGGGQSPLRDCGHIQAVISCPQLWCSVMEGKQHSTRAQCTVQPAGDGFASPVITVIKLLPEEDDHTLSSITILI